MSIVAVLDVVGKSIEELRRENHALKSELEEARKTCELWRKAYVDAKNERDKLELKIKTVQDYADSLAEQCESVSKPEEIKESGC